MSRLAFLRQRLSTISWIWGLTGLLLVSLHFFLLRLSARFPYESDSRQEPVLLLVGLLLSAGLVYLLAVREARRTGDSKALMIWVMVVGVVLRLSMLPSTVILEDDYYRYLWDGAVLAHGFNPYAYAPEQILQEDIEGVPNGLLHLGEQAPTVIERVNHPELRSIYPLTAQGAFVLAHWLQPWSLWAWRVVLLLFDGATLLLLVLILRALKLPLPAVAVYWWSPLVVKEIFNSAHMDVVVLPFVLGALLLALRGRTLPAVALAAIATGAKLWPILLLPVILRPLLGQPRRLLPALCLFGVVVGLLFAPVFVAGLDDTSGFTAYGKQWEMNDALYMLFFWGGRHLLRLDFNGAHLAARLIVGVMLLAWILRLNYRPISSPKEIAERALLTVAALFLLSPTQFPWYYVWVLPFLVLRPRGSLLLLAVLLPIYYLRFHFSARGRVDLFDNGVVWLEYVPVWLLLLREWHLARRKRSTSPAETLA